MSVEADLLREILAELKELNKRLKDMSPSGYSLQTAEIGE